MTAEPAINTNVSNKQTHDDEEDEMDEMGSPGGEESDFEDDDEKTAKMMEERMKHPTKISRVVTEGSETLIDTFSYQTVMGDIWKEVNTRK